MYKCILGLISKAQLLECYRLLLLTDVPHSVKELKNNVLIIEKCTCNISFITYVLDTRNVVLYDKD